MANNQDLKNLVDWGRYNRAVVRAVQLRNFTGYEVIDPGRLNCEPILEKGRLYSMDQIAAINERLNRAAGRYNPSRWAAFIDQA